MVTVNNKKTKVKPGYLLKACPVCHGDLHWDEEEKEWICFQAGHHFEACTNCGTPTEWDPRLGTNPFCASCWDKQVEIENKEKVAASQRAYREKNKEKVAASRRASKPNGDGTKPLPPFPEFQGEWPDEVKIAWLAAYADMSRNNDGSKKDESGSIRQSINSR